MFRKKLVLLERYGLDKNWVLSDPTVPFFTMKQFKLRLLDVLVKVGSRYPALTDDDRFRCIFQQKYNLMEWVYIGWDGTGLTKEYPILFFTDEQLEYYDVYYDGYFKGATNHAIDMEFSLPEGGELYMRPVLAKRKNLKRIKVSGGYEYHWVGKQ